MSYYVCGSRFLFEDQAARAIAAGENDIDAAEELCRFATREASKIGEELGGNPREGRLPSRESIVEAVARRIRESRQS